MTYLLACSTLMKLTPTRTSTLLTSDPKVTQPARSGPSPSYSRSATFPPWEQPDRSKGSEKRATKYPLKFLAGNSSPTRMWLW